MKRMIERGAKLVVASHNKGKVWEINQLLVPFGLQAVSAGDLGLAEPAETEDTFEGNALIKARAAAEGSGLPALADDSGLEIEALDGAPGVRSADWAGPGRDFALAMQRVHDGLVESGAWKKKIKPAAARFVCTLCLAWPDGKHKFYEGKVKGYVVWPPRGGNGFGYDPIFVPKDAKETFGEMEPAAKYAISHRTRAFEKFKEKCLAHLGVDAGDAPNAHRDAAGLAAAAANISTREELVAFIAALRKDLEANRQEWSSVGLAGYFEACETALAAAPKTTEPAWRSMAKVLLAASRAK